jgi:hypothetical protein
MNCKSFAIVILFVALLACACPVSAVWHNGNWFTQEDYDKMTDGARVVHNPTSGVDSKYRDNNPAKTPGVWAGQNSCTLVGNVRSGFNTFTKEVLLTNNAADQNVSPVVIPIQPDGTFRYDGPLAQGDYTLHIIPPFIGLGPDQYAGVHCDHGIVRPDRELLGYAVSASETPKSESVENCELVIDWARYGINEGDIPPRDYGVIADMTKWEWVGWKLRPLIADDELHIVASGYPSVQTYNGLFGDPYQGVFKKLIVRYHYECDGVSLPQERVCVWEDEDLSITQTTGSTWCSHGNRCDNLN